MSQDRYRPEPGEYLLSMAVDQAATCNCRKTAVGAIIARNDRIISTGYNGTIGGFKNCVDGGCPRCMDAVPSGTQLDRCICVHAEQNALLTAARFGVRVEEAECWVTTEPCLDCTKQLIQAELSKVYYWKPYALGGVPIRVEIRSGSSGPPCRYPVETDNNRGPVSFRSVNIHSRIALAWSKYM
jgi:dCMP deaminase